MSRRMQQFRQARLSLAIRVVLAAGATFGIAQLHADSTEAQFAALIPLSTLNGSNGFRVDGPSANALAGFAIAKGGDINGDGIDDYIIGSAGNKAYVVFGREGGSASSMNLSTLNGSNGFRIDDFEFNPGFGQSVGGGGDINGDGFDDIIIGAPSSGVNGYHSGAAFVVFGHSGAFPPALDVSTLNGSNGFEIIGAVERDSAGRSVAIARDINGDGFDDLVVGAPFANAAGAYTYTGSAYVLFGHSGAFASSLNLSAINGSNGFRVDGPVNDHLGVSVSGAGDVNGDGVDDVITGSWYGGSAYVVFGHSGAFASPLAAGSLDGSNGFVLKSPTQDRNAGSSVAGAGDVNGDGYDDVVAGVPGQPTDRIYVVFGHSGAFVSSLAFSALNGTNGFRLDGPSGSKAGSAVAGAGDLNSDGFADIVIGAPNALVLPTGYIGSAFAVFGHSGAFSTPLALTSLNGSNGFRMDGVANLNYTGIGVAGVGDINHDGGYDVVIGAHVADPGGVTNAGSSYVVFGNRPDPIFANGFEAP